MQDYRTSLRLLGLPDSNLPVFKEARARRLASVEKVLNMMNVCQRLAPKLPRELLYLDFANPEFEDRMVYPVIQWGRFATQGCAWALTTAFFVYNWNTIVGNKRLRVLKGLYPFLSAFMLGHMHYNYSLQMSKVRMFEQYTETRAKQLIEQNKYLFEHPHFARFVYFHEDLNQTLDSVHRQANNHDQSDFKDSELILQDFIARHSDSRKPHESMFTEQGDVKVYN